MKAQANEKHSRNTDLPIFHVGGPEVHAQKTWDFFKLPASDGRELKKYRETTY